VEHLGAALTEAGMPRMPARVWAALLADEDGRMTAAELASALGISPAAVSGAVRYLTQVQFIRRERDPGTRRDVYVAMDEMWHDVLLRANQTYGPIIRALEEGVRAAGRRSRGGRRLDVSREFLEFVSAEMQAMAARWEARRADLERT
jgi:DNA-binding transcriptional regulator GbsR (MarR family)